MIEQVFFIVISVGFFGSIFYLMISKNETGYLYFLGLQALGIRKNHALRASIKGVAAAIIILKSSQTRVAKMLAFF